MTSVGVNSLPKRGRRSHPPRLRQELWRVELLDSSFPESLALPYAFDHGELVRAGAPVLDRQLVRVNVLQQRWCKGGAQYVHLHRARGAGG